MKKLITVSSATFVLGILVALLAINPLFLAAKSAEPEPTPDFEAELQSMVDAAVQDALAQVAAVNVPAEPEPADAPETSDAAEEPDPAQEPEQEPETPPEPEPATTPPPAVQPSPSPKPQTPSEYPKYFYEDGQLYAYNNEYAEEMGYKTLIADDDEPVAQSEFYDWENDPLKDVPGGFN